MIIKNIQIIVSLELSPKTLLQKHRDHQWITGDYKMPKIYQKYKNKLINIIKTC